MHIVLAVVSMVFFINNVKCFSLFNKLKEALKTEKLETVIHGAENSDLVPKYSPSLLAAQNAEQFAERLHPQQFVEGDIYKPSFDKVMKLARKRDILSSFRWQGGVIPYIVSDQLSKDGKASIEAAKKDFHKYTCIRLQERQNEKDYVAFVYKKGCWSYLGRNGGRQEISLGPVCGYKGTVMHELMHTLGFFHEHTRSDRDEYIKINYDNIPSDKQHDFKKYPASFLGLYGKTFDFASITGMGPQTYAKFLLGTTIDIKGDNYTKFRSFLGQRSGFSDGDLAQIKKYYCSKSVVATKEMPTTTTETPTTTKEKTTVETTTKEITSTLSTTTSGTLPDSTPTTPVVPNPEKKVTPATTTTADSSSNRSTSTPAKSTSDTATESAGGEVLTTESTTVTNSGSIDENDITETTTIVPELKTTTSRPNPAADEPQTDVTTSTSSPPQAADEPQTDDNSSPSTTQSTLSTKPSLNEVSPSISPDQVSLQSDLHKPVFVKVNSNDSSDSPKPAEIVLSDSNYLPPDQTPSTTNKPRTSSTTASTVATTELPQATSALIVESSDMETTSTTTTTATPIPKNVNIKGGDEPLLVVVSKPKTTPTPAKPPGQIETTTTIRPPDNPNTSVLLDEGLIRVETNDTDVSIALLPPLTTTTTTTTTTTPQPCTTTTCRPTCAQNPAYPCWPYDFSWSYNGLPSNCNCNKRTDVVCRCNCVHIHGTDTQNKAWNDNYLCYKEKLKNPNLKWSTEGPIEGMKCVQFTDDKSKSGWSDNYLCFGKNAPYNFVWSKSGAANNERCMSINEPEDRYNGWRENYLCR